MNGIDWDNDGKATWEQDGFTIRAWVVDDPYPDTSCLDDEDLERYRNGQFCYVCLAVAATINGNELATDSCCGIEYDWTSAGREFVDELAYQMADEAINQARADIASLIAVGA